MISGMVEAVGVMGRVFVLDQELKGATGVECDCVWLCGRVTRVCYGAMIMVGKASLLIGAASSLAPLSFVGKRTTSSDKMEGKLYM